MQFPKDVVRSWHEQWGSYVLPATVIYAAYTERVFTRTEAIIFGSVFFIGSCIVLVLLERHDDRITGRPYGTMKYESEKDMQESRTR